MFNLETQFQVIGGISDNKNELFIIFTVNNIEIDKQFIFTHNSDVNCLGLAPCIHEEADTRIMLHLEDAARDQALICTIGTDVIALAIAALQYLEFRLHFHYFAIHEIARVLGPD